jgi:hypothetical protein
MKANTNIMVTTVFAISDRSNLTIMKEPRNTLHYPRVTTATTSVTQQGLAGGVIGSVLGYELGAGYPIVSGLGIAASSYFSNGLAR